MTAQTFTLKTGRNLRPRPKEDQSHRPTRRHSPHIPGNAKRSQRSYRALAEDNAMSAPTRALVALIAAGATPYAVAPATPAAGNNIAAPRHTTTTSCVGVTAQRFRQQLARTYRGTRLPPRGAYRRLWHAVNCTHTSGGRGARLRAWRHAHRAWAGRRHPMTLGLVSWYQDAGQTASGFHARYGVAVCGTGGGPCVPFGTRITITYHHRTVTAIADDHGPYIPNRVLDLGASTAAALAFNGVDTVAYRIGGP